MSEDSKNIEPDDPDHLEISEEEREKLISIIKKMMEMGFGAVYGQEDEGVPDANPDCSINLKWCRAKCCTVQFALTKEEAKKGHIKYNQSRPFFIARDSDGYCPHLERSSLRCKVWSDRPLRCRRYECKDDPQVLKLSNAEP